MQTFVKSFYIWKCAEAPYRSSRVVWLWKNLYFFKSSFPWMQNSSSSLALLPVPHPALLCFWPALVLPGHSRDETTSCPFQPLARKLSLCTSAAQFFWASHHQALSTAHHHEWPGCHITAWRMMDSAIQASWATKKIYVFNPKAPYEQNYECTD